MEQAAAANRSFSSYKRMSVMIPVLNQFLQTVKDRCQELNICLEQFMWTPCCFKDHRMFMRLESICLTVRLLKSTLFRPNLQNNIQFWKCWVSLSIRTRKSIFSSSQE